MADAFITLEGVRTHNLKNVTLRIPKNRLVVVTGVSGSGKSSLILDTLFKYSKSLYLGALASNSLELGDGDYHVDQVSGTQPPVALEQSTRRLSNPRSTVGTLTGIERMLRVLFARCGTPVCPVCLTPVGAQLQCPECGCYAEPLTPQNFSANHKDGMCVDCGGMGRTTAFSEDRIVPDRSRSLTWIWDNAESGTYSIPNVRKAFEAMCEAKGIPLDQPYDSLSDEQRRLVLHGSPETYLIKVRKVSNEMSFDGIIGYLEKQYRNTSSATRHAALEHYLGNAGCPSCGGGRLRAESAAVRIAGKNFPEMLKSSVRDLAVTLQSLLERGDLSGATAEMLRSGIAQCRNIGDVGLPYLSLDRSVITLSDGELQRILLAQHVASDLTGVMYVLDEPSIGLHVRDTGKLIGIFNKLRDLGNSVIVIEHDETVIRAADWIIEVGPGAGDRGGEIIFEGTLEQMLASPSSLTARCLSKAPPAMARRDLAKAAWFDARPVTRNNLDEVQASIPLNALTCVTGVSGAGKSSLVRALFQDAARAAAERAVGAKGKGKGKSEPFFDEAVYVEQRPIGRSSRSTIATYIGISDDIRDLFAATPEAEAAGLGRSQFSSNVPGGRCETCKGQGEIESDIYFLKNDYSVCPDCGGRQFQPHVLDITLGGKNIHEVLKLTVGEACGFFAASGRERVAATLALLDDFGLGYLRLGQSTVTLSGGEAQRINLAAELANRSKSHTLYVFDEPTRGLHLADLDYLMRLFDRLLAEGHTVLIIEHNLDVAARADHLIDVGPEGGDQGGRILYSGPLDGLIACAESHTGRCLAKHSARAEPAPALLG